MAKKTGKRNIQTTGIATALQPIQGTSCLLIPLFWCLELIFLLGNFVSYIGVGTLRFFLGMLINAMSWPPIARHLISFKPFVFIFLVARSLYWRDLEYGDKVDVILTRLRSQLNDSRFDNPS